MKPETKVGYVLPASVLREEDDYFFTQDDVSIAIEALGWDQEGEMPEDTPATAIFHAVRDNSGNVCEYDEVWIYDHVNVPVDAPFERIR